MSTKAASRSERNAPCGDLISCDLPTSLSAPIFHTWERYDSQAGKWLTMSRISFPINGGRDEGYRGFTVSKVSPGKWRCDVETSSGALIGRISFNVVESPSTPILSTKDL